MEDMLLYWVWLSVTLSADTTHFAELIAEFDTPKAIFEATDEEIVTVIGSRTRDRAAIARHDLEAAQRTLSFCLSKNIGLLPYDDPRYPEAIRGIHTPPPLFYYRGQLPDFENGFFVSVVGMREMTDYGKRNAFHIAMDLSRAGATIVSGMARGIDGVALSAAAALERPTVTVLGCGIDICYPKEHLTLARELVKHGCIMTEFPPATAPSRFNFPKRNRIISGLSAATVVIEGRERSGSVITAQHALSQGRTVYALPGNVDVNTSEASNLLIRGGARLLLSADDVIRDFEFVYPGVVNPFSLNEPIALNTDATLRRFGVGRAKSVREVFRSRREAKEEMREERPTPSEMPIEERLIGFSKAAVEVYRRIPEDAPISTEALIGGELGVREVMKALLQLEVGKFITMLPGERVRRN